MHKGERMAVTALDGFDPAQSVVPAGLLVVPHSFPLHLMMHLRQVSGHPVLLASEERFAGVCDDGDILRALCGVRGGVKAATDPKEMALAQQYQLYPIANGCVGLHRHNRFKQRSSASYFR